MKITAKNISSLLATVFTILISCNNKGYSPTHKDLDENMIDLKAYQENMGDEIKAGTLEDAVWLLEGLDSVLNVVAVTFPEHRKLEKPFADYYDSKMKRPIEQIGSAIKNNNQKAALEGYKLLVRRCNSCHKDLDIDKEVKY